MRSADPKARSARTGRRFGVAALVVLAAACGSASGIEHISGPPVECPEDNCPSFMLHGAGFSVSCGAVRKESVSDKVLATGTYAGKPTEVRAITDVDPTLVVAIKKDAGACVEGRLPLSGSEWSLAERINPDDLGAMARAMCKASAPDDGSRDRC